MPSDKIQANYEQLGEIAKLFDDCREVVETMMRKVISTKDTMMEQSAGDWAEAFDHEMAEMVLPTTQRLMESLGHASETVKKISNTMSEAEDSASACFR